MEIQIQIYTPDSAQLKKKLKNYIHNTIQIHIYKYLQQNMTFINLGSVTGIQAKQIKQQRSVKKTTFYNDIVHRQNTAYTKIQRVKRDPITRTPLSVCHQAVSHEP